MKTSRLIKGKGIWRLQGLRGLEFPALSSVLDQVLSDPNCPPQLLLVDLNETYGSIDLQDSHVRQLLWQKL